MAYNLPQKDDEKMFRFPDLFIVAPTGECRPRKD